VPTGVFPRPAAAVRVPACGFSTIRRGWESVGWATKSWAPARGPVPPMAGTLSAETDGRVLATAVERGAPAGAALGG